METNAYEYSGEARLSFTSVQVFPIWGTVELSGVDSVWEGPFVPSPDDPDNAWAELGYGDFEGTLSISGADEARVKITLSEYEPDRAHLTGIDPPPPVS